MPVRLPLYIFFAVVSATFSGTAMSTCLKDKPESTPTSRFVLKGGEAFDRKTKLTWSRCSVGASWNGSKCAGSVKLISLDAAKEVALKRGNSWHVPTIEELASIGESRCINPTINSKVFPDVKDFGEGTAPYWSRTKIKEMPGLVYFIDFLSGEADGHTKEFSLAVRLVRNGK